MAEKCNDAHNHTSCFATTIILLRWIFEVQFPCIISSLSLQEEKNSKAPKGLNKTVLAENGKDVVLSGSGSGFVRAQEFGNSVQAPGGCEMPKCKLQSPDPWLCTELCVQEHTLLKLLPLWQRHQWCQRQWGQHMGQEKTTQPCSWVEESSERWMTAPVLLLWPAAWAPWGEGCTPATSAKNLRLLSLCWRLPSPKILDLEVYWQKYPKDIRILKHLDWLKIVFSTSAFFRDFTIFLPITALHDKDNFNLRLSKQAPPGKQNDGKLCVYSFCEITKQKTRVGASKCKPDFLVAFLLQLNHTYQPDKNAITFFH